MERHCQSALRVAEALQSHPTVRDVHYPGLKGFKQHDLAKRQMYAFGGMVPFELEGGKAAGVEMMNRLQLVQRA